MKAGLGSKIGRVTLVAGSLAAVGPVAVRAQTVPPEGAAPARPFQQFDDWRRQCDPPVPGKPESCFIFQKIVSKDSGQNLLAIAFGYYGEKQVPAAIVTVPLGVFLPAGLKLEVPGAKPITIGVETCTQQGCRGGSALTDDDLAALKKGTQATFTMEDQHRRPLTLPISLKGFSKGFASLKKG